MIYKLYNFTILSFYCIFNQRNAALVSIRDFQKHLKLLLTPLNGNLHIYIYIYIYIYRQTTNVF